MPMNLDFIPQPDKREIFKGFDQVSNSCPVYNPFIDTDYKGYEGMRKERPLEAGDYA